MPTVLVFLRNFNSVVITTTTTTTIAAATITTTTTTSTTITSMLETGLYIHIIIFQNSFLLCLYTTTTTSTTAAIKMYINVTIIVRNTGIIGRYTTNITIFTLGSTVVTA